MPEKFLRGRRVLIVENDYFMADDMRAGFDHEGAEVVGPFARVSDALDIVATGEPLDGAVLDINLAGETDYQVADALSRRGVPFIFVTGYDAEVIPEAYAKVMRCEKPIEPAKVGKLLFNSVMRTARQEDPSS